MAKELKEEALFSETKFDLSKLKKLYTWHGFHLSCAPIPHELNFTHGLVAKLTPGGRENAAACPWAKAVPKVGSIKTSSI